MDNDVKTGEALQQISLIEDWGTFKQYHIECMCGSKDDSVQLFLEPDDGYVSMLMYATVHTKSPYEGKGWFNTLYNKLKICWNVLFKGYASYEAELLLKEKAVIQLSHVLTKSVTDIKEYQSQREAKRKERKNDKI